MPQKGRSGKRVALVTYRGLPEMEPDERQLLDPLAKMGMVYEIASWDDPDVAWEAFDLIVIRSPWNYYKHLPEFLAWVDRLESRGCHIWNPPSLVRWNADKRYLQELESAGLSVVPTEWLESDATLDVRALGRERGWAEVVVKPVVSAGGYRTHRVLTHSGSLSPVPYPQMVQPYLPEIEVEGEWSLIYFAGAFSHAIRKLPASGEFRIQEQYGGSIVPDEAPAAIREIGDAVMDQVRDPWLYGRVDGVRVDGQFYLMELEMIEPRLYLKQHPDASNRLARAIADRL